MATHGTTASTREVQELLTTLGFPVGAVDGVIGPKTRRDTGRFQLGYNLGEPLAVDGVAGPLTSAALRHSVNDRGGRCSDHFRYNEFRSNGNGGIMISRRQVRGLESLRAAGGGRPISTISDYRDPDYNKAIGGASRSMHLFGAANDLPSAYGAELQMVRSLDVFSGIGWKRVGGKRIVLHVDTRGPGQQYVDENGRVQSVPVTTAGTPTSPTIWEYDAEIPWWDQVDLPDVGQFGDAVRRVVLVGENDGLNVRSGAGAGNTVIGVVAPGAVVGLNGPSTEVGSSTWLEIATPIGAGWVDGQYLTEVIADDAFRSDGRIVTLLDRLTEIIRSRGDLTEVVSSRGLYVGYHGGPIPFSPADLPGLLADPNTRPWPSNATDNADPPDPAEQVERTFTDAVGDSFASTWADPDRVHVSDEPMTGGNGRQPADAVPYELRGFHYLSVFDPGDDPDYRGVDWTAWHASVDYRNGEPRVVGLTIDHWAP